MWTKAFGWAPAEKQFYMEHSQTTRRSFGQKRRPVPVFTTSGVRRMPTARPAGKKKRAR